MKKSLLFTLLTAILMALLMTSVAQAKKGGNNPGDDNEGTTTVNVPFIASGYMGAGISCYNPPEFCQDYYLGAGANVNSDLNSDAYAFASAYLSCHASSSASAQFGTVVFAEGNLQLNRHGLNGSMHHIEMNADFGTATTMFVNANAWADAFAGGDAYAHAFGSNYTGDCGGADGSWPNVPACWYDYCTFADLSGYPDWQDLCVLVNDWAHGDASSVAHASAAASGWADGYSDSTAGMSSWTGVWAANIERFAAVVGAGASAFNMSTASANVSVMVDTFAMAYMDAYTSACADLYNYNGYFWQVCTDGYASAWADAYSYAYAYADAHAAALVETHVGMSLPALYVNENGPEDTVIFGDPDAGGGIWGHGLLSLSCSAGPGGP